MTSKVNVGLVGCGNISAVYLRVLPSFENLSVVACADLLLDRAHARAAEFGVPKGCSVEELLADPTIEIVLNLTIPNAHASVAEAALRAGKSAYNEKPLAITPTDGRRLLTLAAERGLRIGGAPDTFLGGGLQTCRKLIDDGVIGEPVAATAFWMTRGHEHWHPDPDFYYQVGAGPMFDMGPYYLTALVHLLGPVRRVAGLARTTFQERTITSQPKYGTKITVNTPTHIAATLEFANGAIGSIITSFDVCGHNLPRLEVHGTAGSLSAPDPNTFGGPVRLRRLGEKEWSEVELTHGYTAQSRGVGVADMAAGLRSGRPSRASGDLALHVLDIMQACLDSSSQARFVELTSQCQRPASLPIGLRDGEIDK